MGAFNGSGTFVRSYSWVTDAANSVNISAPRMDTEDNGFAAGLSNCLTRDGQSPPTTNLPMSNFKFTGLAAGTTAGDSVRYEQLTAMLPLAGGTMTGKLNTVATAAVAGAGFNVPAGVAPSTPAAGDFWNVGGALFYYTGAVTRQVATLDGAETLSNKTLTAPTINGGTVVPAAAPVATGPGYLGTPPNNITASYTITAADFSKDIYISGTTAGQTVTIPANATLALPAEFFFIVTNDSNQNWTIALTTDTLFWSPNGTTGNRTLAAGGRATVRKTPAAGGTRWWIEGSGLT